MSEPVAVPIKPEPETEKPVRQGRTEPVVKDLGRDMDFASFEATKGVPYAAEALKVTEYYKNDFDGETKPKIDKIMEYLAKLGDSIGLAKDVLETIKSRIAVKDDEPVLSALNRVYHYILAEERITPLKKKKEKLEEMIEKEMVKQLKKFQ